VEEPLALMVVGAQFKPLNAGVEAPTAIAPPVAVVGMPSPGSDALTGFVIEIGTFPAADGDN
jgi:hypothetical protein